MGHTLSTCLPVASPKKSGLHPNNLIQSHLFVQAPPSDTILARCLDALKSPAIALSAMDTRCGGGGALNIGMNLGRQTLLTL